jgi:hypothetical protein
MKRIVTLGLVFFSLLISQAVFSQTNTYHTSGGEMIFSWGDLKYTDDYLATYSNAEIVKQPIRFTAFFHVQQFWHVDFGNNFGFFTGIGLRNIGMISDEYLPDSHVNASGDLYSPTTPYPTNGSYFNAKVIRRTYSLGIPLAIKLGSFKDHLHIYGGGEIEWSFHMKEKWWESHSRNGSKTKTTEWWPTQITTFLPSAMLGVQFPGGVNLKFKYYLENFLNHDYNKFAAAENSRQVVSDLTKYEQSQLFYISLSFHFKTSEIMQYTEPGGSVASIY